MPSRHLFLIRIALVIGVTAFAALAAYQRAREPVNPEQIAALPLETMRYVLWGLAVAAVLAALFLRSRLPEAAPARRGSMVIIGWSFGEGVALFGTVLHYVGAELSTMITGLLAFALVLLLLPVTREPLPPPA